MQFHKKKKGKKYKYQLFAFLSAWLWCSEKSSKKDL